MPALDRSVARCLKEARILRRRIEGTEDYEVLTLHQKDWVELALAHLEDTIRNLRSLDVSLQASSENSETAE